ncbi:DUF4180 domain-containing protein [Mumia zhuanghuii]|uniref:DUF4180 domain-containing protein n=2 Tax=Mumia TaxID=1546255 RepID=A0ABW1QJH5_9ACTN|nr:MULTISPECIES: DUF4180 domain-containing protein [Mumia]KAA1424763.1 DUF4180 domain-containing protein [Mumia zhuanghuii]
MRIDQYGSVRVLFLDAEGPLIATPSDGSQLVGDVFSHEAQMVAVPVSRLDPSFFQLRSGLAGEILQKLVNYRIQLAVVGDISAYVEDSDALRDLVRESNQGSQAWFVPDAASLEARLGPASASA